MAEINKDVNSDSNLTTYSVTGSLHKNEVEDIVKDFYSQEPSQFVLWDVTSCSQIDLSAADLEQISKLISETRINRPKGKTAFVINENDLSLGILFENFAKMKNLPYEYRSFNSPDEALAWFGLQ